MASFIRYMTDLFAHLKYSLWTKECEFSIKSFPCVKLNSHRTDIRKTYSNTAPDNSLKVHLSTVRADKHDTFKFSHCQWESLSTSPDIIYSVDPIKNYTLRLNE